VITQSKVNMLFNVQHRSLEEDLAELDKIAMPDDFKAGIVKMFQVRDAATRAKWFIGWGKKCAREATEASQAAAPTVTDAVLSERRSDIESTAELNSQFGEELTCKPEDLRMFCSAQPLAPAHKHGRGFNYIGYQQPSGLAAPTTSAAPISSLDDPEGFGPMEDDVDADLSAPPEEHDEEAVAAAPVVEAPVVEAPVVEAPVVAAPVVEAPVVEAAVVAAPVVAAPVVAAQRNYVISTMDAKIYAMQGSVQSTGDNTGDANTVIGSTLTNTKSREWIVVRKQGATVQEGFRVGMEIGTAATAATFRGCCYVFLLKPFVQRARIPEHWVAHAPVIGKTADDKLVLTYKHFTTKSTAFMTNLGLETVDVSSGIFTYEQMTEYLRWFNMRDWHRLHGDAKRAERLKFREFPDLAPLHRAVLLLAEDLTPAIREKDKVGAGLILRIDAASTHAKCPVYWCDATQELQEQKIFGWSSRTGTPFDDTLNNFMCTPLHRRYSLIVFGPPEMFKSQLLHQMAKTFTIRKGLEFYCFAKSIDPCGVLAKWGILQMCGMVAYTDMDFTTQRGEGLLEH